MKNVPRQEGPSRHRDRHTALDADLAIFALLDLLSACTVVEVLHHGIVDIVLCRKGVDQVLDGARVLRHRLAVLGVAEHGAAEVGGHRQIKICRQSVLRLLPDQLGEVLCVACESAKAADGNPV